MSQKAFDELNKIKEQALENQIECAWCNKVCKNADHLVMHIWIRHPAIREER